MKKQINFDLDGTLNSFYSVDGWLESILASDPRPYAIAEPRLNLSVLARYLHKAQAKGYEVNIISWLAKNSTIEYDEKVINAKKEWLNKHLPSVNFDNIYIVPYGTPKSLFGSGILFDDEEPNRKEWKGKAYNEQDIMRVLKALA